MQIDVLTLFPAMFAPMHESMMWKAQDRGFLTLRVTDIRDFTQDKHRTADDIPYGGGGGMVMRPNVLVRAIESVKQEAPPDTPVIYLSPQGRVLTHAIALDLSTRSHLVLLCGHYEGIDDRVLQLAVTDELSIGDYVLTGGELAAARAVGRKRAGRHQAAQPAAASCSRMGGTRSRRRIRLVGRTVRGRACRAAASAVRALQPRA